MKPLILAAVVLACSAVTSAQAEASDAQLGALTVERALEIKMLLFRTKYPVRFSELYTQLGAKEKMAWILGTPKTRTFAVSDPKAESGVYAVEFVAASDDDRDPLVTSARFCFLSLLGTFYADPLDVFPDEKRKGYPAVLQRNAMAWHFSVFESRTSRG